MSQDHVVSELSEGLLTVRLNRADKKNALTGTMYSALAEVFSQAATDSAVRAVLLAGAPGAFSSGNDLIDFVNNPPTDATSSPVALFMAALSQFPKPVVAAVSGLAIGIGSTILLHCDLVYAADNTRFSLPFINIGICPEFGSTLIMPAMMGHQRAAELLLLGETFDAAKAREVGMINEALPADQVEARALAQAQKFTHLPPNALRVSKALLKRWPQEKIADAIRVEGETFMPMLKQPEAMEAITAFQEKRKPDFSKFS